MIKSRKYIIVIPIIIVLAAAVICAKLFTPLFGEPKYIFIKFGTVNGDIIYERFVKTDEIEKMLVSDSDADLSYLKHCKNLHRLKCICHGSNIEFLNGLDPDELDLYFLNGSESNDLSTVSVLKNLKRLSVSNSPSSDNGNKIDLSPLSELGELEYLDIGLMYVSDLDFLAGMDSLEVVRFDRFKADDYSGLLKAASLKEVVYSEMMYIPEDIISELTERGVDVHLYEYE